MIGRWKGFLAIDEQDPVKAQKIRECRATIEHHLAIIRESKAMLTASRNHLRALTRKPVVRPRKKRNPCRL